MYNLEEQMKRVLPEPALDRGSNRRRPVFNSFFEIKNFDFGYVRAGNRYYGMFEDNDPQKRLLAIAGHNQDLGEFWEFSDTGIDAGRPVERGVQVRRELLHLWIDSLSGSGLRAQGSGKSFESMFEGLA